jgi:hypothetical protein
MALDCAEDTTTEGAAMAFHDGNYDHNGGDLHGDHGDKRVTVSGDTIGQTITTRIEV